MNERVAEAYQAIIDELEARVATLVQRETRRHHLVTIMAPQNLAERQQTAERIAALEAAARAVVDTMTHWKDGTLVWCSACDPDEVSRGHQVSCQIGALAALLDGDA